jgi:hypothetical protein
MFNGYSEEKDGRMYYYIKKSLVWDFEYFDWGALRWRCLWRSLY